MSLADFTNITPHYFYLKYEGFKDAEAASERNFRNAAWLSLLPHLSKNKPVTPEKLWKIRGDDQTRAATMFSEEQIKANIEAYKSFKIRMLERTAQKN